MKMKFTLENGCSRYGAQMGRRNEVPDDYAGEKLRMLRLPFVDGCYDRWGAYWGSPANVWCAWGESATERVRIFVRGNDRAAACREVLKALPSARFARSTVERAAS
jgi:hypothetical protein